MRAYFYERNVLNELMAQEETYWRQRAKVFWLEEGDTNSHFFSCFCVSTEKDEAHLFS